MKHTCRTCDYGTEIVSDDHPGVVRFRCDVYAKKYGKNYPPKGTDLSPKHSCEEWACKKEDIE